MVVKSPQDSSEKIRDLDENSGGLLVSAENSHSQADPSASITIRVPAARFDEVRTAIRKLGLRVDEEKLESQDVTKQYVDQSARLRNLRAQETQYLGILRQAKTVKDTIEVSEKLDEVRGQIETQQAELDTLSKQVETVALTVSLHSVGDYAASMASFLF